MNLIYYYYVARIRVQDGGADLLIDYYGYLLREFGL